MSAARKLLVFGGIMLALFGMAYGLHYAVFVEHQTLDDMGRLLTVAFSDAAVRNVSEAQAAIAGYGATKYTYVRQVDVHSHWIGLAMVLIVLGVAFDHVGFGSRLQLVIASAMLIGSAIFPAGVLLQTMPGQQALASPLAIAGAGLVILGLGATAVGFARGAS